MKSADVVQIIKGLGERYDTLVSLGVIPDKPLEEMYKGRDKLYMLVEAGFGLDFDAHTRRLERAYITLIKSTPTSREYAGELPAPFAHNMSQGQVRSDFGRPSTSKGQMKMPGVGEIGGWDEFRLDERINNAARVVLQYTTGLQVSSIVFSLID